MINRKRRCQIRENENLVIPKGSRRCGESVNGCYLLWMPSLSFDVPIQEETKSEKMDGIGLQSDEPNRSGGDELKSDECESEKVKQTPSSPLKVL
ncbi:hypothetical protein L1887_14358 [Cichorium endivia]|nr:hypothetical protein L1887_14358 [Cichorium endivia]